jgi:hypothetical protein
MPKWIARLVAWVVEHPDVIAAGVKAVKGKK